MDDTTLTRRVETWLGAKLEPYAAGFHPVDAYAVRDGRMIGYVERKTRNVSSLHYPTVIVDERKWVGLITAEWATGTPAILVVGWNDDVVKWIRPAAGHPVVVEIAKPGPDSVSLNRGVPRPVVHIPTDAFEVIA